MTDSYFTIENLLKHYAEDLEYYVDSGELSSLNHYTSSTMSFDSLEEARDYISKIRDVISLSNKVITNGTENHRLRLLLEQERDDYELLQAQNRKLLDLLYVAKCMLDKEPSDILTRQAKLCGIMV